MPGSPPPKATTTKEGVWQRWVASLDPKYATFPPTKPKPSNLSFQQAANVFHDAMPLHSLSWQQLHGLRTFNQPALFLSKNAVERVMSHESGKQ